GQNQVENSPIRARPWLRSEKLRRGREGQPSRARVSAAANRTITTSSSATAATTIPAPRPPPPPPIIMIAVIIAMAMGILTMAVIVILHLLFLVFSAGDIVHAEVSNSWLSNRARIRKSYSVFRPSLVVMDSLRSMKLLSVSLALQRSSVSATTA